MKKSYLDKLLCILIIICPVLDILSFVFRNIFETKISPSTILRPIISIFVILNIFYKSKDKWKIFWAGVIYCIYSVIHLYLFKRMHTGSSYGTIIHEAQYLINYCFMILNLFLYIYIFGDSNSLKLKNSILISNAIYIISIYIAILTKTSSTTYIEGMGYKGWFESGNSLSAILILSQFIILTSIRDFKPKWLIVTLECLIGIFLISQLGTRVGLYGFILVLTIYIFLEILFMMIKTRKINKKVIAIIIGIVIAIILLMTVLGSNTIKRRQHINNETQSSFDNEQNEVAHLTGDVIATIKAIKDKTLQEGFLSEAQSKSYLELYDIANKYKFESTNRRLHQVVYNIILVKNQQSPILILFGNGYLNNYGELVLEMELLSFILNFGIIGFLIFLGPFIWIMIYSFIEIVKNIKKIDQECVFLFLGSGFSYLLSLLSGYVFFNSSSMIIVIVLHVCLINKIKQLKTRIK